MSYLSVLTKNLTLVTELNDNEIQDLVVNKELSGDYSLRFKMPLGAYGYNEIQKGRYIRAEGQNFAIQVISPGRDINNLPMLDITAVHIFFELEEAYIPAEGGFRATLLEHLNYVFDHTDFYAVAANNSQIFQITRFVDYQENQSKVDALKLIFRTFGGYFMVDGFKCIVIPPDFNMPNSGVTFSYAVNNQSISKVEDTKGVITVLYATGGRLYIDQDTGEDFPEEDSEGNKLDRPVLGLQVKSPSHIRRIYRKDRVSFVNFGDIMLMRNLEYVANKYLEKHQLPRVSYGLTIAELKRLSGLTNAYTFDIGQLVTVRDTELGIDIIKPIQKYTYKPLEPHNVSQVEVGDKLQDIYLYEERKEDGVGEWRYCEICGEWILVRRAKDDKDSSYGDAYTLEIIKAGCGYGFINYKFTASSDKEEESTLTISSAATSTGIIGVRIANESNTGFIEHFILISSGDSRVAVAQKIAAQSYPGWEVEYEGGWAIKFTSQAVGRKFAVPAYDSGITAAEGRFNTQRGSLDDQESEWITAEIPFTKRFGDGDTVIVDPTPEDAFSTFVKWTGEGEGDIIRTFVMDNDQDATAHFTASEPGLIVNILEEEVVLDPYGDKVILKGDVIDIKMFSEVDVGFYWSLHDDPDPTRQRLYLGGATGGYFQFDGITFPYDVTASQLQNTLIEKYSEDNEDFDLYVIASHIAGAFEIKSTLWTGGANISANFSLLEGATDPVLIGTNVIGAGKQGLGEFTAEFTRGHDHGTVYYVKAFVSVYDKECERHLYSTSNTRSFVFPYEEYRVTFMHVVRYNPTLEVDAVWKLDDEFVTPGTRYYPEDAQISLEVGVSHDAPYEFIGWAINEDHSPDNLSHLINLGGATGGHFWIGNKDRTLQLPHNTTNVDIYNALVEVYKEWDEDGELEPTPVLAVTDLGGGEFRIEFERGKGGDLRVDYFFLEGATNPSIEEENTLNTSNPINLTITADMDVYAVFKYTPPKIIVTGKNGKVNILGILFDLPCNITELISDGKLHPMKNVTISAVPDKGYYFSHMIRKLTSIQDVDREQRIDARYLYVNLEVGQEIELHFTETPPYDHKKLAQMMLDYAKSLVGSLRDLDSRIVRGNTMKNSLSLLETAVKHYRQKLRGWGMSREIFKEKHGQNIQEFDPTYLIERLDRPHYSRNRNFVDTAGRAWISRVGGYRISFSKFNVLYRRINEKRGTIIKTGDSDPRNIADSKSLSDLERPDFERFVRFVHFQIGHPEDMYTEMGGNNLAAALNSIYRSLTDRIGRLEEIRDERRVDAYESMGIENVTKENISRIDETFGEELTVSGFLHNEPYNFISTEEPDPELGEENDVWFQYEEEEE